MNSIGFTRRACFPYRTFAGSGRFPGARPAGGLNRFPNSEDSCA